MNRVSTIFRPGFLQAAFRIGLVLCIVVALVGVFSYQASSALAAPLAAPTGQTIWLRANANSRYVSADQSLPNVQLIANRTSAQAWELFTVVDAGGGLILPMFPARYSIDYVRVYQRKQTLEYLFLAWYDNDSVEADPR